MTNEQINERIAKLCGWKPTTDGGICWDSNGNAIITYPNYAESLDACMEFSYKMSNDDHLRFQDELVFILPVGTYSFDEMGYDRRLVIDATPLQRCEAFLRAKGQWDEN